MRSPKPSAVAGTGLGLPGYLQEQSASVGRDVHDFAYLRAGIVREHRDFPVPEVSYHRHWRLLHGGSFPSERAFAHSSYFEHIPLEHPFMFSPYALIVPDLRDGLRFGIAHVGGGDPRVLFRGIRPSDGPGPVVRDGPARTPFGAVPRQRACRGLLEHGVFPPYAFYKTEEDRISPVLSVLHVRSVLTS